MKKDFFKSRTFIIIAINCLMYLITMFVGLPMMYSMGISVEYFKFWQPFTSMWMHGGFFHLLINMFVVWSFASVFKDWNNRKFWELYIYSGLAGSFLGLLFQYIYAPEIVGVGASGAICGLLGSFAYRHPNEKVLLFFFIPVKVRKAVYWFAGISFFLAITNLFPGVGHGAHLGGMLFGYFATKYWGEYKTMYRWKPTKKKYKEIDEDRINDAIEKLRKKHRKY